MTDTTTILLFLLILFQIEFIINSSLITDEKQAESYLKDLDSRMAKESNKVTEANWKYETDINQKTSDERISATKVFNDLQKKQSNETKMYDWSKFKEYNQRQFEKYAVIGTSALNKEDEDSYTSVTNNMETIYSSAKVCVAKKCDLSLDPDLDEIMSKSTNYDELKEAWVNWRDASGKKMRNDFITYYTLGNKAAKLNLLPNKKFVTFDDLWLFPWETPDIKEQTADLWNQLKPFYEKIHAFVRMKLKIKYPGKLPEDGTIPAHLLGNMWAQSWGNLLGIIDGIDPYPNLAPIDVTKSLVEENYTSKKLFELSEKFFVELGLDKMTDTFWQKSIIDKQENKEMVCHASAWDFFTKDDYRIKMCTKINMNDLITIHHEMGHIQYYMQYKNQPLIYKEGANPGFHEAIGDLLALSVATPKHLKKIGLLNLEEKSDQVDKINLKFQLKMALDKVMFLPFGYLMDKYRWDVFSGKASSDDLNRHWWKLRGEYQGISPPIKRSENDFDPGAKYHIPAGVEYIRYFASHIFQFQFHKKLCSFSQKDEPLHKCDIDGDREAGLALKNMLQKGSSEKWTKQLKDMVGTQKMDIQPLLEYFKPLQEFLDKELEGKEVGWKFNVEEYFTKSTTNSSISNNTTLKITFILITIISFLCFL